MTPGGSKRSQKNSLLPGRPSAAGTCITLIQLLLSFLRCLIGSVSIFRASERHNELDSQLKEVQVSLKDVESSLRWLQEAETTVNVLADASRKEDVSQDSTHTKQLRRELEVRREADRQVHAQVQAHYLSVALHYCIAQQLNRGSCAGACVESCG